MTTRAIRILAWSPVLTDHQAYTYQELARQSGLPVIAQVVRLEDDSRRAQGWTDTRVDGVERQLMPVKGFLRYGLRRLVANRDQIHLFGSAFENPRLMLLLWLACVMGLDCYIISEPYSNVAFGYLDNGAAWRERLKALLRPWLYRGYVLALRSGIKGIFTISRLATAQYEAAGMPSNKLFPFGYFVPSESKRDPHVHTTPNSQKTGLRLVFVGSLIERKGLATLIEAVRHAQQQGADVQLTVYGPGDPGKFDFDGRLICYEGRIPFGQTQHYLPAFDMLVLPSHYDGWGVVVNEALCAGIPVICSDQVGARVLVETFAAGDVFPRGDAMVLATLLTDLAASPAKLLAMKAACQAAAIAIQPVRAAAYMLQVLRTVPAKRAAVPSPWYGVDK
jgi:glycosyltransferase involved in cell wall biosynthesis